MPITDPIFLTTFQGSTINRDGVTYVWVNGKYEVSSQISPEIQEALMIPKKVELIFYGILEPNVKLNGSDLQVFIDGQEINGEYKIQNENSVLIKLDEMFLRIQRLITFKTSKGNPKFRYCIKSKVYNDKDIVIAKIGISESIPVLGSSTVANALFTPIISNTGTSNTGINTNIGVSVNYESTTVDIGVDGFNLNNQVVDATIGEVAGPIYQ